MKRLHLMLTFVLVAGLLLACGGGEAPTPTPVVQPTEAKAPAVEPTETKAAEVLPTPVPPTDTPAPPTPEVKPEAAEEELLTSAEAALEALSKLKSFRSYTHYAWVSQEEGEEKESGEFEMRSEYVAEPPSQHMVITSSGDAAMGEEESETFEIIQIEDRMWFQMEEDQWMQAGQQEFLPNFLMSAEEFLRDLSGARRLWPDETVNGIRCRYPLPPLSLHGERSALLLRHGRAEQSRGRAVGGGQGRFRRQVHGACRGEGADARRGAG